MSPSTIRTCLAGRVGHLPAIAAACAIAASLGGCYVVPIDLRTGQPYPAGAPRSTAAINGAPAAISPAMAAPLPSAPPQPSLISVRLYPLNPQANKAGMLVATVIDNNAGHGSFGVSYLGDAMQGESSRVDSGYASFGRLHDEVLGRPDGAPRAFSGRRGIANAYGSRGVNAQCEYLLTGPASGTGVCLFSDGAKYQMHFAG